MKTITVEKRDCNHYSNKPMKCLAIGGCHMEGYPIGFNNSFIHKFSKRFTSDVHVEANFPLSHTYRISALIKEHDPGIVILQLGNFEFDASLKKTFDLWARKKRIPSAEQPKTNDRIVSQTGNFVHIVSTTPPVTNNRFLSLLQWACLPPTILVRKYLVAGQMRSLKEITQQFPHIKFIVLTPLPVVKATDNWIRKRAARYFKHYFKDLNNVSVIDTHETLKHPPVFADESHLNKIGHDLLQYAMEQELT
ncbi:hypothetical protein [Taibaiella soli]|uniref:SGNH/GDSL hydrolase family protein n=1 Tax=Taibaiella soli TaxID=1649169 RepID=A0A2W2B5V3_9BACT|nr:hypothetical protein [Taibaiella soli]PZF71357.1 hypothetical protein DN068_18870 [Taibaiella soli]